MFEIPNKEPKECLLDTPIQHITPNTYIFLPFPYHLEGKSQSTSRSGRPSPGADNPHKKGEIMAFFHFSFPRNLGDPYPLLVMPPIHSRMHVLDAMHVVRVLH